MKYVIILLVVIAVLVGGRYFAFQQKTTTTQEQAVENVKKLPEVQDYLKRVPKGQVVVDNELEGSYNIQVYEVKDGHTATFNWYTVNTTNGEIKKQF